MYFFEHEVVPIIPVFVPFIDETQLTGYIILGVFHITLLVLGILGVLACDFFMAIIIISTLIFAKLTSMELEQIDIDQQIEDPEISIRGRFKNVLLMHQEMIR